MDGNYAVNYAYIAKSKAPKQEFAKPFTMFFWIVVVIMVVGWLLSVLA